MSSDDPKSNSGSVPPEQRVGAAMREARESAGISLRDIAKRLSYNSHTTLSSHERGAVMPTEEAVKGYEQVLGLEPGTLMDVLESARIERHGDAWAKRRVHLPAEFVRTEPDRPESSQPTRKFRWSSRRWAIIPGAVLVLALVALVVDLFVGQPGASHVATSPVAGVRDGSDPKVTGCATGAVTSDSVDVYDPPEHLAGVLQLRSSARCGTSWGRFVPTSALTTKPALTLEIDVDRPADGAAAKFHITYDGQLAYGNMLISSHECVYAKLTLIRKGQPSLPPVQTACRQAPGG